MSSIAWFTPRRVGVATMTVSWIWPDMGAASNILHNKTEIYIPQFMLLRTVHLLQLSNKMVLKPAAQ